MTFLILAILGALCLSTPFFNSSVTPPGQVGIMGPTSGNFINMPAIVRAVYSQEVLFEALPKMRFLQFAKVKTDPGGYKGSSVAFTRYGNSAAITTPIGETNLLGSNALSTSDVVITLDEYGFAYAFSEKQLTLSRLDVLGDASKLLASNLARSLDLQLMNAAVSTANIVYGAGKTTLASLALGDGLTAATVKNAVEVLANNNAPKINDQYYVCIASPHQLRQLRDDAAWIDSNKYRAVNDQIFLGEAGMYEGVIFIETTQMPVLATSAVTTKYGSGFTPAFGYEAVFLGENAIGWAVGLMPELRDDGVTNFGRIVSLAWYGIWGTGIIEGKNSVRALTA